MQKIEKIYKEYYEIVYKYLFCLTHDKDLSEDLAQETFVKMIKNIDKFKGQSKLSSWLCEIAKNLWIDYLRKNKKQIELVKQNQDDKCHNYYFNYIKPMRKLKRKPPVQYRLEQAA